MVIYYLTDLVREVGGTPALRTPLYIHGLGKHCCFGTQKYNIQSKLFQQYEQDKRQQSRKNTQTLCGCFTFAKFWSVDVVSDK